MKIAFTTSGKDLAAPLDLRFGRAAGFLVYDLENDTFTFVDNMMNSASAQGAGVQAAETMLKQGVSGLVTGHCGPKAFRALSAAGIKIYTTNNGNVATALEDYRNGKLSETHSADVEGHW